LPCLHRKFETCRRLLTPAECSAQFRELIEGALQLDDVELPEVSSTRHCEAAATNLQLQIFLTRGITLASRRSIVKPLLVAVVMRPSHELTCVCLSGSVSVAKSASGLSFNQYGSRYYSSSHLCHQLVERGQHISASAGFQRERCGIGFLAGASYRDRRPGRNSPDKDRLVWIIRPQSANHF